MSEWQPIETAPKDRSVIMLANQYGVWMGHYEPVYQSGFRPENPWSSLMMNRKYISPFPDLTPTHWQPLPEPPK